MSSALTVEESRLMSRNGSDVDKSSLEKWEYANYLEVAHNAYEFFFDFGQGDQKVKVYTRIATNPYVARQLCELLKGALERYASKYGEYPAQSENGE